MNELDRQNIAKWIGLQLDDQISPEEIQQLEQLVSNDPEARRLYLGLRYQDAHLRQGRIRISPADSPKSDQAELNPAHGFSMSMRRLAMAAVGMSVAASLLFALWWNLNPRRDGEVVIARITDSSGAEWEACTLPTEVGSELVAGRLRLKRGLVTLRFTSGAVVTLESPAELLVETPMLGTLLSGVAVVDVPESAHGFTIATPTAKAIDHGTAFAVIVNASRKTSSIEVLEGEVEVQHNGSDANRRLYRNQQMFASESKLSDTVLPGVETERSSKERDEATGQGYQRVTTAIGNGDDAAIIRGKTVLDSHKSKELILVKNPFPGDEVYCRKGYFAFDLNSVEQGPVSAARFVLTLQPSGLGFSVRVPDCKFSVYGLTDESLDDWSSETISWDNAPANLQTTTELDPDRVRLLGQFVVARGVQYGNVSIEGGPLVELLN